MLVAFGALASWQNPTGMLRVQIFVNLPLEFSVRVELLNTVRHSNVVLRRSYQRLGRIAVERSRSTRLQ